MAGEFKIGRLRYTWKGIWAEGVDYNRDAVAQYNGKTYLCLEPHTSQANFYDDLRYITPEGANTPRWELVLDGRTWKQDWEPDTFYSIGNIVRYSGTVYICTVDHTSGSTVIDLANWATYSQYDNWANEWMPATDYGFNDMVKYGGIVYRCLVDHQSSADYTLGLEADQANWEIVNSGVEYKQDWLEEARYKLNDLVKFGSDLYICTTYHTSTDTFDLTKWATWLPGEQFVNVWNSAQVYQIGDIVIFGGYSYISLIANNTGEIPSTQTTSWELVTQGYSMRNEWDGTDYEVGDIVRRGGSVYTAVVDNSGADPIGDIVTKTVQDNRELVTNGSFEADISGWTGTGTWNAATSALITGATAGTAQTISVTPNMQYNVSIDNTVRDPALAVLEVRISDGSGTLVLWNYASIDAQAGGDDNATVTLTATVTPTTDSITISFSTPANNGTAEFDNVSLKKAANDYILNLNDTTGLVVGMTVISKEFTQAQHIVKIYDSESVGISKPSNYTLTALQEINFIGVNAQYWRMINPGVTWRNFWAPDQSYILNELVIWQNVTYRCISPHNSIAGNRPDLNLASTSLTEEELLQEPLWIVYSIHAKENAGNTQGDIVAYIDGKPTAVPILPEWDPNGGAPEPQAGDTDDYLFRVEGHRPNWANFAIQNDVYYVATDGVDEEGYGKSPDKPFASVRYACDYVYAGTSFKVTKKLMEDNRDFLVEEMYQWMVYQKENNISPFSIASEFNEYSTRRDAKLVVDAIAYDIGRRSNSRTIIVTEAYFSEFSRSTFFNQATDDARVYIVEGLRKLLELMGEVFEDDTIDKSYQNQVITLDQPVSVTQGEQISQVNTNFTGEVRYSTVGSNTITLINTTGVFSTEIDDIIIGSISGDFKADPADPGVYVTAVEEDLIAQQSSTGAIESDGYLEIDSLMQLLIRAIEEINTDILPPVNQGATTSINVKTGTFSERLPIVVPDHTAIIGDELRSTVIQPKNVVYTATETCTAFKFKLNSIVNVVDGDPIQFSAATTTDTFGGENLELNTTYYIRDIDLTTNEVGIAETPGGVPVELFAGSGYMTVYAGDALKDMFLMRDSTGLRNCTLTGLAGSLTAVNGFGTRRPTGGAYTSLDGGEGPEDTRGWIIRRSPYVQNVTNFGVGCVGLKIDGTLHNGGNKSIVCNDYTQVISDGIGVWCTGPAALTECVSVFSYYNYAGYFAEDGGRIRATNGNSSYGTFGVIAEGFDDTEVPITGKIDNQSVQVQADVQSAFGAEAELLAMQYANAGSNYITETINLVRFSNQFDAGHWNFSNVISQQNTTSPFDRTDGWTFTGTTDNSLDSFIYQSLTIPSSGAQYTALSTVNVSGSGTGATFDISVGAQGYSAVVSNGGSGYVSSNILRIPGSELGGENGTNDCFLEVTALTGSSILDVNVTGTVPTNTAQNYTFSIYVKKDTAPYIEMEAEFSGNNAEQFITGIRFTFDNETVTTYEENNGIAAYDTSVLSLTNGWYRVSFTAYDSSSLNDTATFRIHPRGRYGLQGSTRFYGAQIQLGDSTTFYAETRDDRFTSVANYTVIGAGTGVVAIGNETRSQAIYEIRLTDEGFGAGGRGYEIASNNAQGGTDSTVILSGSDTALENQYLGMRVFLQSGTGAGQYGYISDFDDAVTKTAQVLKESFDTLTVTSTSNGTGTFELTNATTDTLYVDQRIQFIPTYYQTAVEESSTDEIEVTETIGGQTNTFTCTSTAKLSENMQVRFKGTTFGGVINDFTYWIKEIIDEFTFTVSTESFGNIWLLNDAQGSMTLSFPGYNNYLVGSTSSMLVNMPIRFTGTAFGGITVGTTYYVNRVVGANEFTISSTLIEEEITATAGGTNYVTIASTTGLVPLNPIEFRGVSFGNINPGFTYYVSSVVNATTFTMTDIIISTTATETASGSNLITVTDTSGLVVNNPIQFIGNTFGNIINSQTYYILAINDATTFTVSASPGGSAITLSDAVGEVEVRSAGNDFTVSTETGTMTASTTNAPSTITTGYGAMNGTYSTKLFGGVESGVTYYVNSIPDTSTFTVSATQGGAALVLKSEAGSMNVAAVGWDHINPGTPIKTALDNSTVYYVEPRIQITSPGFAQTNGNTNTLAPSSSWTRVAYGGGSFVGLADGDAVAGTSTDGTTWTSLTLLEPLEWTDVAYGNGVWVLTSKYGGIGEDSGVYYSASNLEGWRKTTMPSNANWNRITYGNGAFVAIAKYEVVETDIYNAEAAYSTDLGRTWISATTSPSATGEWNGIAYGGDRFVAIGNGTACAYSTDNGVNWTDVVLPTSSSWIDIAFGNGVFVAISADPNHSPIYSVDGITWVASPYSIVGCNNIAYGDGVFVATATTDTIAYTSENGATWTPNTTNSTGYGALGFGYDSDNLGIFVTLSGQIDASVINTGCTTKARANVISGKITSLSIWEPGSGYTTTPTINITDPNVTLNATTDLRLGTAGTLGNPTFVSRGNGYNTNSTQVAINGDGFADKYQTGLTIIVKDLTKLPGPGDNLVIDGNEKVYKVTNAEAVFGTVSPNIKANIQIAPDMSVALSPDHDAEVTIRQKYSQARLTGHDYLNVGYGNEVDSNYPNLPEDTVLAPQDQAVEVNYGRVFFQSTDQDGNFNVGGLFAVEQATGIVTVSASQFGLQGLETLSLGGIAVGGSSVIIRQFSTDETFIANSNSILPTQRSIKAYLESRLTQGGSNTFTGQLIAGTVLIGGPNRIASTIPEGSPGAVVKIPVKATFAGQFGGWDGDGMAYSYFTKSFWRR
jgi:hypothetical protein